MRDEGRARALAGASLALLCLLPVLFSEAVYPVKPLLWHGVSLLWWAALLAAALGQGLWLLRRLGVDFAGEACLGAVAAAGLGLGALSLETFLLAFLHLLRPAVLTLLVVLSLGAGAPALRRWWRDEGQRAAAELREGWKDGSAPLLLAGLAVLLTFLFCLPPTFSFDALNYHLEVPARFLAAGGVLPIPENVHASNPLLGEMLYALGLGLDGQVLAQLLGFSFFPLTLGLVWSWSRGFFGPAAAGWGTAVAATLPCYLVVASEVGVDWSAAFFTLGAVLLLASPGLDRPRSVAAGLLAGMAAGTKYPALAFALVLPAAARLAADRWEGRSWGESCGRVAAFLLAALALASPWYLKNLAYTGDPFFPLLSAWLGDGAGRYASLLADAHFAPPVAADLWRWAAVPVRLVGEPAAFQLGWTLGILPLALAPALFALRGRGKGDRYLLLWGVGAFAAWYLTFRMGRFLLPMAVFASAWLGAGLAALLARAGRPGRWVAGAVVLVGLANLGVYLGAQTAIFRATPAALGMVDPERFLDDAYPPYAAIRFLNRLDPPAGKVLFVGETRGYYSRFPREVPSFADPHRLLEMVRGGRSPAEMAGALREAGFTHLLLYPWEWERMARNYPSLRLGEEEKDRLSRFFAQWTKKLFEEHGVLVYEVTGG